MSDDWLLLLLAGIPILVGLVLALVEVIRRTDLGPLRTAVWVGALIAIPVVALAVYAIVRPLGRRFSVSDDAQGPPDAERLVEVFELRQRGEIGDDELRRVLAVIAPDPAALDQPS